MRLLKSIMFFLFLLNMTVFADEPLLFLSRFSECVNRWVALQNKQGESDYDIGFIYIDLEAGPTYQMEGTFKIDDFGHFIKSKNDLFDKKLDVKMRLGYNGIAAILSTEALKQLGLPEKPDWLKVYDDGTNSPYYRTRIGFWLNVLGDYERALASLESAYKDAPETEGLKFELTFAYNALGKFNMSIPILQSSLKCDSKNVLLGSELAYANMQNGNLKEAIELYLQYIPNCPDDNMQLKSEMAFNLANIYGHLKKKEESEKWLEKAKKWAPEGTPVYNHFNGGS